MAITPDEYWRHDFEYEREEVLHRLEAQNELGQAALKSMMLANGGAIVALLTFIGNKGPVLSKLMIKIGFGCFGAGLFVCLLAYFFAYFSQAEAMYVAAFRVQNAQSQMYGRPGVEAPPKHEKRATAYLLTAIGLLLVSLLAFGFGSCFTLQALI